MFGTGLYPGHIPASLRREAPWAIAVPGRTALPWEAMTMARILRPGQEVTPRRGRLDLRGTNCPCALRPPLGSSLGATHILHLHMRKRTVQGTPPKTFLITTAPLPVPRAPPEAQLCTGALKSECGRRITSGAPPHCIPEARGRLVDRGVPLTNQARWRSMTSMAVLVTHEPGGTGKALATPAARIALLLRVAAQMAQEAGLLRKSPAALGALEGLLADVCVPVLQQRGQAAEAAATLRALEGPLSRVRVLVLQQRGQAAGRRRPWRTRRTRRASPRCACGSGCERRLVDKGLTASGAGVGTLGHMRLAVAGGGGPMREALGTLSTSERPWGMMRALLLRAELLPAEALAPLGARWALLHAPSSWLSLAWRAWREEGHLSLPGVRKQTPTGASPRALLARPPSSSPGWLVSLGPSLQTPLCGSDRSLQGRDTEGYSE